MTIKQPYQNIFLQLRDLVLSEINAILNRLPQTIPCKVVKNNGQTVDVQPTINLGVSQATIKKIPIAKSKYLNIPFTAGDQGMLIPASYIYDDLILNGLDFITSPKKSTSMSGYIFIPLVSTTADFIPAGTETALYSKDGSSYVVVKNGDITLNSNEIISFNNLKTFLDQWQISYNLNLTVQNANNGLISTALAAAGHPVTLAPLNPYNGSYR